MLHERQQPVREGHLLCCGAVEAGEVGGLVFLGEGFEAGFKFLRLGI